MALKYAVKSGNWSGSDVWGIKLTGTVSFTNGDSTVTGSGTAFTSELVSGDKIFGADGVWYMVDTVIDDTTLKLNEAYSGSSASGVESYKQTSYPAEGDNAVINANVTVYGEAGDWVVGDDTGDALTFETPNGRLYIPNTITGDCSYKFKGNVRIKDGTGEAIRVGDESAPIEGKKVIFYFNYSDSLAIKKYNVIQSPDSYRYVYFYGKNKTWKTYLTTTANSGDTQIIVNEATGWEAGDEIVIVTTANVGESEKKTISSISDTTITLDSALSYTHSVNAYVLNITRSIKMYPAVEPYGWFWRWPGRGVFRNVEIKGGDGSFSGVNYRGKPDSNGNPDFLFEGNVIRESEEFFVDSNALLNIKNLVCYKVNRVEQYSNTNYANGTVDGFFFCQRNGSTSGWVLDFGSAYWKNVVACDFSCYEMATLFWPVYMENVKIFAIYLRSSYHKIFYGAGKINGLTLGEFNATNFTNYPPIFDDDVRGEFTNCDVSTYLSNGGSIRENGGSKEDRFFFEKVVFCYGGSFGDSTYYGLSGRGETGSCLVIDPVFSNDFIYVPTYSEGVYDYIVINRPIIPFSFPVNSGKTITLSFWVKVSTSGFDGDLQIAAEGCGINYSWTSVDLTGADSDWVQRSFTLGTTTDKGFVRLKIRAKDGATVSGDIYLDDFAITES